MITKGITASLFCQEYHDYKITNPAPFTEVTHFHFAIFLDSKQLILKLNQRPNIICSQL